MIRHLATVALAALGLATISGCSFQYDSDVDDAVSHEFGSDHFAAGGLVNLTETVAGDAFLVGGHVTVATEVNGDLVAAGGEVSIGGSVGDDLYAAGGNVKVDAMVTGNARIAGGDVEIGPATVIAGIGFAHRRPDRVRRQLARLPAGVRRVGAHQRAGPRRRGGPLAGTGDRPGDADRRQARLSRTCGPDSAAGRGDRRRHRVPPDRRQPLPERDPRADPRDRQLGRQGAVVRRRVRRGNAVPADLPGLLRHGLPMQSGANRGGCSASVSRSWSACRSWS